MSVIRAGDQSRFNTYLNKLVKSVTFYNGRQYDRALSAMAKFLKNTAKDKRIEKSFY